jgi:hypothetical protein
MSYTRKDGEDGEDGALIFGLVILQEVAASGCEDDLLRQTPVAEGMGES